MYGHWGSNNHENKGRKSPVWMDYWSRVCTAFPLAIYGTDEDIQALYTAISIPPMDRELSRSAHAHPGGFRTIVLVIGRGLSGWTPSHYTFITCPENR